MVLKDFGKVFNEAMIFFVYFQTHSHVELILKLILQKYVLLPDLILNGKWNELLVGLMGILVVYTEC